MREGREGHNGQRKSIPACRFGIFLVTCPAFLQTQKTVQHEQVDVDLVARATAGSSGAELANIVNEAALRAVRAGRDRVTTADLEESVETVIAGAQKKGKVLSEEERKIVSYHETGHALVAALQTHSAPVHKITIVPRTSGALGYTMQVDSGEQALLSREDLFNRIATLTGGRAAEEAICHTVTTGASNDIEQATRLARAMVTRYGMSAKYDMMGLETVNNAYLGGDTSLACSADTAADIDREVLQLIQEAHAKARELITTHADIPRSLSFGTNPHSRFSPLASAGVASTMLTAMPPPGAVY